MQVTQLQRQRMGCGGFPRHSFAIAALDEVEREPSALRRFRVPKPGHTAELWLGAAIVGLVAFRMRCYGEFLEFNLRTHSVDGRGRRGVVFLTMEADRLPWVL